MAVYTKIEFAEAETFLRGFDLPPLARLEPILAGVSNSNYRLVTTTGQRFILTLFESRTPDADLPYFIGLTEHWANSGLPCPRPLRNRQGETLHRLGGRAATIMDYLAGADIAPALLQPQHCAAAGSMLAQLHKSGLDYKLRRRSSMGPEIWHDLLLRAPSNDPIYAAALKLATTLLIAWPEHLPQSAIHADYFPDNVLFDGEVISGVIDPYFACTGLMSYDLALALNAWCMEDTGVFKPTQARVFLHSYQANRELTKAERSALPLLLQASALRIFATRNYDWQHCPTEALVRPKDPKDYALRLATHCREHETISGFL
jgi:homoserine kinase type II